MSSTSIRVNPRISLSKTAEYMVSGVSRRRTILADQKFPAAFKTAPFRAAREAILQVMLHGGDVRELDAYISSWRARRSMTRFESQNNRLCIEALSAFRLILARGEFNGMSFMQGISEAYLHVSGVDLSIRPDLLIRGQEPGALKLYIVSSIPLVPDVGRRHGSASYAPAMLHWWTQHSLRGAPTENCLVVDVFAGAIYRAPERYTTRRSAIEDACEEIVARWPSITDPRTPRTSGPSPSPHGR